MLGEEPQEVEVPEWYPLIRAARYAGVPVWELENMPTYYRDRYLMAESAEQRAESILRAEANRRNKRQK